MRSTTRLSTPIRNVVGKMRTPKRRVNSFSCPPSIFVGTQAVCLTVDATEAFPYVSGHHFVTEMATIQGDEHQKGALLVLACELRRGIVRLPLQRSVGRRSALNSKKRTQQANCQAVEKCCRFMRASLRATKQKPLNSFYYRSVTINQVDAMIVLRFVHVVPNGAVRVLWWC